MTTSVARSPCPCAASITPFRCVRSRRRGRVGRTVRDSSHDVAGSPSSATARTAPSLEDGSIEWLCWPRPDSSFVFGPLLDREQRRVVRRSRGSTPTEVRQEYVENTNVLRTDVRGRVRHVRAARLRSALPALRPVLQAADARPHPAPVERRAARPRPLPTRCTTTASPRRGRWRASNHIEYTGFPAPVRLTTNVPLTYVEDERPFLVERDRHLVLTWGEPLEAGLEETAERFLERTLDYWRRWVKGTRVPRDYQREVDPLRARAQAPPVRGHGGAARGDDDEPPGASGLRTDVGLPLLLAPGRVLHAQRTRAARPLRGDGAVPRLPPQPLRGAEAACFSPRTGSTGTRTPRSGSSSTSRASGETAPSASGTRRSSTSRTTSTARWCSRSAVSSSTRASGRDPARDRGRPRRRPRRPDGALAWTSPTRGSGSSAGGRACTASRSSCTGPEDVAPRR